MNYPTTPPPFWSRLTKRGLAVLSFSSAPIFLALVVRYGSFDEIPNKIRLGLFVFEMIIGLVPWCFAKTMGRASRFYLVAAYTFGPALSSFFALLSILSTYSEHKDLKFMYDVLAATIVTGLLYFALRIHRAKRFLKETTRTLLDGRILEKDGLFYFTGSGKAGKGRYSLEPNWILAILSIIGCVFAASMGQQNTSTPGFVSMAFVFLLYFPCYVSAMVSSLVSYLFYEFLVFRELERIKNRPIYFEDALPKHSIHS